MDLSIAEWADLGRRLRELNQESFDRAAAALRRVVESEECLADHDDKIILRPKRPKKRYSA